MKELSEQATFHTCKGEPMIAFATFHNHWMGWEYEMDTDAYGLMPHIRLKSEGLKAPVQFKEGSFDMLSQHRIIDGAHFFWLVNNTESSQTSKLYLPGINGAASIWDCETGTSQLISANETEGGLDLELHFDPLEAYWVVVDPEMRQEFKTFQEPVEVLSDTILDGPWTLRYLDEKQPELEPVWTIPAALTTSAGLQTELVDWALIPDLHERFTGFLDYYRSMHWTGNSDNLVLDLGQVHDMAEVWVNGQPAGKRLWAPYRFDISGLMAEGPNRIRIRVGNQVDNYYANPVASGLLGPVKIHIFK